ncbi:hypothetical protein TELCIR_20570, partial [Teladorsagia circumcincta]
MLYERIMIFLIALGIGALSGSSMFIMLPQSRNTTATTITPNGSVPSTMAAENRRHADVEEKEKAELAEEVEIAMLNNAFART